MEYINIKAFIISFAIGMCINYLFPVKKQIIIKHPVKDDTTIYHDNKTKDLCYRYSTQIVDCPKAVK